jgi:hypothetical protein
MVIKVLSTVQSSKRKSIEYIYRNGVQVNKIYELTGSMYRSYTESNNLF